MGSHLIKSIFIRQKPWTIATHENVTSRSPLTLDPKFIRLGCLDYFGETDLILYDGQYA